MEVLVTLLVVVGAMAGLIAWGRAQQKKRIQAMQGVAAALGWSFTETQPLSVIPGMERFGLFSQGRAKEIRNFIAGEQGGVRAAVFDYSCVTGYGRSKQTHFHTVFYARAQDLGVPGFSVRPENLFHRIGSAFGYQDIDLPSRPVFSKQYLLRGRDEAAIRAAFHDGVVDFYEANPKSCTDAEGAEVFLWRGVGYTRPDEVQALVRQGVELVERLRAGVPAGV
ncbi:MAG TPA: hypothetical protein VHG28_09620 [Longimicrobiaceae bacterium]|nr:hypothetical protein [Longimicrobiaceae bacterium]